MFHIALYEPRIAPNTGNIIRLVANNGCSLHLIEPLGFSLDEKSVRRAGGQRVIACTTRGTHSHASVTYVPGDVLLFGSETTGLPAHVHECIEPGLSVRIPMQGDSRSLNLSNAVAVVSYEAWRQQGFAGGQ
jgi:tRNA (cytidine/uridine-2'-O-)-methyltransferase